MASFASPEAEPHVLRRIDAVKGSLWKPPRLIRGEVVYANTEIERELSWSELFFDLIFVTAISRLGDEWRAAEISMSEYAAYFFVVWKFWGASCDYSTRFYTDDVSNKLFFFLFQFGVVGLAVNLRGGFRGGNFPYFAGFAAYIYLLNAIANARVYFHFRKVGKHKAAGWGKWNLILDCLRMAWWLCSVLLPVSLVPFVFVGAIVLGFLHEINVVMRRLSFGRMGIYPLTYVPLHIEHFTERLGGLVIIFLGECINGIAMAVPKVQGFRLYAFLFGAFWIVYAIKLIYFDVNIVETHQHAMRVKWSRGIFFWICHPLLGLSIALFGESMAEVALRLGKGEDEADIQTEVFAQYLGAFVGAALIFATGIQMSHKIIYKEEYRRVFETLECVQFTVQLISGAAIAIWNLFFPTKLSIGGRVSILGVLLLLLVLLNFADEFLETEWAGEEVSTGLEAFICDVGNLSESVKILDSLNGSEHFEAVAQTVRFFVVLQGKQKLAPGLSDDERWREKDSADEKAFKVCRGVDGRWRNVGVYTKPERIPGLKSIPIRDFHEPTEGGDERYQLVLELLYQHGIKTTPRLKRDLLQIARLRSTACKRTRDRQLQRMLQRPSGYTGLSDQREKVTKDDSLDELWIREYDGPNLFVDDGSEQALAGLGQRAPPREDTHLFANDSKVQ